MPGLDGTGPMGMGPMTGGARGWCNPYGPTRGAWGGARYYAPRWNWGAMPWGYGYAPGYWGGMYPRRGLGLGPCGGGMAWGRGRGMGFGRGIGFGRGMGRGWGYGW